MKHISGAAVVICLCLLVQLIGDTQFASAELLGCQNLSQLTKSLSELRGASWQHLGVNDLQKLWPIELTSIGCSNASGCRTLYSEDRIISGHCECCAGFEFDGPTGSPAEHLSSIHVHYAAADKGTALSVARQLAGALGLRQEDMNKLTRTRPTRFTWEDKNVQLAQVLEVNFSQLDGRWIVIVSLSRHKL